MANKDKLYERLREERRQTAERVQQLKASAQEAEETREGSPFGKREEEASEAFELEKRLALEEKLNATLAKIDHALEKWQAGTYGLCDSCGKSIEQERLEALPQASLCLSCKARQARNASGTR